MPNYIEHAKLFQQELDQAAIAQAVTGWMEGNAGLVKYNGGDTVMIPSLSMNGLGDYDRDEGFADGDVSLKYEAKTMGMDRGRRFTFDENEVDETNFVLTASKVMGEFQRLHVLPEVDAYRLSTVAAGAIAKNRGRGGYTPTANDVLKNLYEDIAEVEDVIGQVPLIITINTKVAALLDMTEKLRTNLEVTDFQQGDVTLRVQSINGQYPLIRAGSGLMKTKYLFKDGRTDEQKVGGFAPADDAKNVNWIICPKSAPIAVSKTDNMRIFDPETYQPKRAWACDYRRFHDLWVTANAYKSIFVNVKEALG